MIKEINIKEDMPPTDVAVAIAMQEIKANRQFGDRVIKFLHGYGSTGVGGSIRIELRKQLDILKRQKQIIDYIKGEQLTSFFVKEMKYDRQIIDELLADNDYNNCNKGVTIVIIK